MRAKNILPFAFLGLALTACNSDEVAPTGGQVNNFAEGGFMKLAINLPTESANRAENDKFSDGLKSEYTVHDATLILFQGNDEATATLHSAYDLAFSPSEGTRPQVTVTSRITEQVQDKVGDNLYAFVVLNKNKVLRVGDDNTLTVNGQAFAGTFGDLQKITVTGDAATFTSNGLLMTSAALATTPGGTSAPANVQTLTNVSKHVYETKEKAESMPAADIFVERAMAKVTMQPAKGKLIGEAYKDTTITYELKGWNLDITNNSSYLAHNVSQWTDWRNLFSDIDEKKPRYRFAGDTKMPTAQANLYRTYWGVDPNYDDFKPSDFGYVTETQMVSAMGDGNPLYCMENTFDLNNQKQDRTTRVVAAVKFNAGITFYTVNGDKTKFYTQTGLNDLVSDLVEDNHGQEIDNWLEELEETAKEKYPGKAGRADITGHSVTFTERDAAGTVKVKGLSVTATVKVEGENPYTETMDLSRYADETNQEIKNISEYKDGIAYYPIRIKHFGDDLTPWNTGDDAPEPGNSYMGRSDRYLGRYGVLRNNWYDLTVTSIAELGNPGVPPRDNKWDDNLEKYISVRINVLSWAKRQQNVEL